jgi:outer membrane lipoprotein carrier protein
MSRTIIFLGLIAVIQFQYASAAAPAIQLRELLSEIVNYQAEFSQQVTDAEGTLLQQASGQVMLLRPGKLRWQMSEPDESLLIADGQTLWHLDPFVEQVIAMDQASAIAENPVILLTDDNPEQWQQYQITRIDEGFRVISGSGNIVHLDLYFFDSRLIGLTILDRQQQLSEFNFSKIKQNHPIEARQFVMTVPEGFELDDQRDP